MTRSVRHLIAIALMTFVGAGIVSAPTASHAGGAIVGGPLATSSTFVRL